MSEAGTARESDLADDDEGTSSSLSVDENPKTPKFKIHIVVQPQGKERETEVRVSGKMSPNKHTSRLPPINKTCTFGGATTSISYSRQQSWRISHRSKESEARPTPRVVSSRYHAGCCPPQTPIFSLPPTRSPKKPSRLPGGSPSPINKRTDLHFKKSPQKTLSATKLQSHLQKLGRGMSKLFCCKSRSSGGLSSDQVAEYLDENPTFLQNYVTSEVEVSTLDVWRSAMRGAEKAPSVTPKTETEEQSSSCWSFSVRSDKKKTLQELADTLKNPNSQQILLEIADCISAAVKADGFGLFAVGLEHAGQLTRIIGYSSQAGMNLLEICPVHDRSIPSYVARTGHTVRTSINDSRFSACCEVPAHDPNAAFFLCVAIAKPGGEVVAVLNMWRQTSSESFKYDDEELAESFLMWGGIALHYSSLHYANNRQSNLTAFLLVVAKSIFQDMVAMDPLMRKVMTFAQKLVNADRASLFLVDQKTQELYATIFDVGIEAKSDAGQKKSADAQNFISANGASSSKLLSAAGSETDIFFDTKVSFNSETIDTPDRPEVLNSGPSEPLSPKSGNDSNNQKVGSKPNPSKEIRFPVGTGIAGHVAKTGEVLNIKDAYADTRFNRTVDQLTGYRTNTILCMPIYIRGDIIGVVQMVNKHSGFFTKEDEKAFEMFAVYCGLALHHAKLYDKIKRSEQKYKVALEVLSYHNTCTQEEVDIALEGFNPANIIGVDSYYFSPFNLEDFEKASHAIYMFTDLFGLIKFDRHSLVKFTLTVKKNYRRVPYHNWTHGFSVANCMYAILKRCKEVFTPNECLALYIGSLCHDLDHRGKNNKFMLETESPLAAIYSTSTMEHHHFNQTVTILQQEGHNIFSKLSNHEYKEVLSLLKHCILATDLALFFGNRAKLSQLVSQEDFSWNVREHRLLIQAIAMTASDLSASAKPWDIQVKTVSVIFEEFYEQGDAERDAGRTPIPMMDRHVPDEQPASQVGFLTGICIPCYSLLNTLIPETKPLLDMCQQNLAKWRKIDQTIRNQRSLGDEDDEDLVVCAQDAADTSKDPEFDLNNVEEDVLIDTLKIDQEA